MATLLLAGVPASMPAAPQGPGRPEVILGRTTGTIRLDGILDEPDWQTAGLIPGLTQQSPLPGGPTPYHTEVRLLTDGATIYIGVRCADPEPGRIATHTMLRDADLSSDDAVGFVLDTFGDHRTGFPARAAAMRRFCRLWRFLTMRRRLLPRCETHSKKGSKKKWRPAHNMTTIVASPALLSVGLLRDSQRDPKSIVVPRFRSAMPSTSALHRRSKEGMR